MSNYIEYKDKIAFHPGYYIKEIVEESGLTQADFAKKLDTTPKNLSVLINGEQSLSIDIATKLSRMLGTSVKYWLNLQQSYDAIKAEFVSEELYIEEQKVFKSINYNFFVECYSLPNEKAEENQIKRLREYLKLSSLKVLKNEELSASFRGYSSFLSEADIINSNALVQIAMNEGAKSTVPKYDKKKFEKALDFLISTPIESVDEVENTFKVTGVTFMMLPGMEEVGMDSLSKKVDGKVIFAMNDRYKESDEFWQVLIQEASHIKNNEYGIGFKENKTEIERIAKEYAQEMVRYRTKMLIR